MNLENEIIVIRKLLKIPINKIEINGPKKIKIYSSDVLVGEIDYLIVSDIVKYDSSEKVVNYLKWDLIYSQNKTDIDDKVNAFFENAQIEISLGTFRNLYVRERQKNNINFIHCEYENGWKVNKLK